MAVRVLLGSECKPVCRQSPRDCVLAFSTPHQALFEEGAGGAASENRLANFLRVVNVPGGEEGAGMESMMGSEEEGEGGGLW